MAKARRQTVTVYGVKVDANHSQRIKKIADLLLPLSPVEVPEKRARRLAVQLAEDLVSLYRREMVEVPVR